MSELTEDNLWLLPEGFSDILPNDAWQIEGTRQNLLNTLYTSGYELVIPPMAEFLDSLLTGTGSNLAVDTFKITDRYSGRTMGVRADFTPQISRIDAHLLGAEGPARLCYAGKCLRTHADVLQSREPIIVGAELFGASGGEADREIIMLMIDCLRGSGLADFDLSLGHVSVIEHLGDQYDVDIDASLLDIMHRKDVDGLNALKLSKEAHDAFAALMKMIGGEAILQDVASTFSDNKEIQLVLASVRKLAEFLHERYPDIPIHFDFSEARGYSYHNGMVFNALDRHNLVELGRGGRYDNVGEFFGRSRSATGFSMNLNQIYRATRNQDSELLTGVILAPNEDDVMLDESIRLLRSEGMRVVKLLDNEVIPSLLQVDGHLVKKSDAWVVESV